MHIFVERHFLDISDTLARNMQNFSRNVVTEPRREILRRGSEIFVLSERSLIRNFVNGGREGAPFQNQAW